VELTVVVQVQDHGVPALHDTGYLRVIVLASKSSWRGQRQVRSRSPSLPRGRSTAVAGVTVAVACCAVVLVALTLILVIVVRRRTSHCKNTDCSQSQTRQCYVETVVDNR